MSKQDQRLASELRTAIARFISEEADATSLITVTKVEPSGDGQTAEVLISVYPQEKEEKAFIFLRRRGRDIREYIKKNTAIQRIPMLSFSIDAGERNRQRIEEISGSLHERERNDE